MKFIVQQTKTHGDQLLQKRILEVPWLLPLLTQQLIGKHRHVMFRSLCSQFNSNLKGNHKNKTNLFFDIFMQGTALQYKNKRCKSRFSIKNGFINIAVQIFAYDVNMFTNPYCHNKILIVSIMQMQIAAEIYYYIFSSNYFRSEVKYFSFTIFQSLSKSFWE